VIALRRASAETVADVELLRDVLAYTEAVRDEGGDVYLRYRRPLSAPALAGVLAVLHEYRKKWRAPKRKEGETCFLAVRAFAACRPASPASPTTAAWET
jgi:hypothetical protein